MKETKFKQTEVGMIPSDWEVKTLGELFDFSAGGDLQKESFSEYPSGTIKWPIYSNSLENKGLYGYTSNPRYRANCVTITGRGSLGHAEYRREAFDAIVRLLVLSPKQHVDCYFVSETINFRVPFVFESTGVPQLTAPQAAKSKIPLPPTIEEQQRIANALSDVDTLIVNLEKLIAKKKNIKQGAMQQLLTGKKRLPGFAGKWSDFVLGQSGFLLKNSINPQFSATKYFSEYSMPAYDEIQKPERVLGCSMHSNRTQISGEVLLFNKLNVRQKRVWYVRKCAENAVCSMEFLPYCSKKIDLQLLRQILLTDEVTFDFIGMSTGTSNSQKRIAPKNFLDYSLRLPQDIREQKAIAEILVDMDSEIQALNKKIIQYRKLKTGMMQQLLTGKIRLV